MDEHEKESEEEVTLEGEQVRLFRSVAARCNYLSQDRPDTMFAVNEICGEMACPTSGSWMGAAKNLSIS